VGLRKVIGANRSILIRQFITESLLISMIALGLSVLLVEFSLPFFNDFIERRLELNYLGDGFSLPLLAGIALLSGLVAGSYPAFYLSSFKPITILRKNSHTSSGGRSPLRNVLVVVQFTISIALIIGVGIVQQQLDFVRNKPLGFEKENLVVLPLSDEMYENYEQLKPRLLQKPGINQITIASRVPSGRLLDSQGGTMEKDGEMQNISFRLADVHVGHDYLKTLKVPIIAGRDFDVKLASDSSKAFILNRAAIDRMGYNNPEEAVGSRMNYGGRTGRIIGVTEDFHFESLHQSIMPVVFVVTQGRAGNMVFRINENNRQDVLAYLEEEWKTLRAGFPFTSYFINDEFSEQYNEEDRLSSVVNYFSILAIVIAALGLLGLASFTAERRFKEIGIRKVMGANVSQILILLTKNFTLLVLVGFVLAIPIAWYTMSQWLDSFAYQVDLGIGPFLWAGGLAILLAWLTISWQAYRAATRNPIDALRQE
jgi:putative ABC transport system permease protein